MKYLKSRIVVVLVAIVAAGVWIGGFSKAAAMPKVEKKIIMVAEKPVTYMKNIRAREHQEKQAKGDRKAHRHHRRSHRRHHETPAQ